MISVVCRGCGREFTVPDELAGDEIECPTCRAPSRVPPATPPRGDLPLAVVALGVWLGASGCVWASAGPVAGAAVFLGGLLYVLAMGRVDAWLSRWW